MNKVVFWSNTSDISFIKKDVNKLFNAMRKAFELELNQIPKNFNLYNGYLSVSCEDGLEIKHVKKLRVLKDEYFLQCKIDIEVNLLLRKSGQEAKLLYHNSFDRDSY